VKADREEIQKKDFQEKALGEERAGAGSAGSVHFAAVPLKSRRGARAGNHDSCGSFAQRARIFCPALPGILARIFCSTGRNDFKTPRLEVQQRSRLVD
jgi:hypothetical protein